MEVLLHTFIDKNNAKFDVKLDYEIFENTPFLNTAIIVFFLNQNDIKNKSEYIAFMICDLLEKCVNEHNYNGIFVTFENNNNYSSNIYSLFKKERIYLLDTLDYKAMYEKFKFHGLDLWNTAFYVSKNVILDFEQFLNKVFKDNEHKTV